MSLGMARVWKACLSLALMVFSSLAAAQAPSFDYTAYIDADGREATGCNVTLAPGVVIRGAEHRVIATATGLPPRVTAVSRETCAGVGAGFASAVTLPANYPVALNLGVAGSDVVEIEVPRFAVVPPDSRLVRIYFVGQSRPRGGQDVLLTTNGATNGDPILFGFNVSIPGVGYWGLVSLAMMLALLGVYTLRRHPQAQILIVVLTLGSFSLTGYALLAKSADGNLSEWAGMSPVATDPAGDGSTPENGNDLRAAWLLMEGNQLIFRLDVTDLENQPPIANAQSVTTLEDTFVDITLSATDPESAPLTFAIVTPPTGGTLGAITQLTPSTASVRYTPNVDRNGSDSFTFRADDGQLQSAPATVSLTVTPVNDAPQWTAVQPPAVNEDAAAQSVSIATALRPGPVTATDETSQILTFTISNNSNAALFNGTPTISAAGLLSYTPAANANGSAVLTVVLSDNGGTANGGINAAAAQTLTVTVNAVNDAPVIVAPLSDTMLEDATRVFNTANGNRVSFTDLDAGTSPVQLVVSGNGTLTLATLTGLTGTGNGSDLLQYTGTVAALNTALDGLSFRPALNENGSSPIAFVVNDQGNTGSGGPQSTSSTVSMQITPVNDAPSYTFAAPPAVAEDAGAQSVTVATAILPGPPNELQTVMFQLTPGAVTGGLGFTAAPAISPTGTLTYTAAPNSNGTAQYTILLFDNGGIANGGVNEAPPQTMTITVNAVDDLPVALDDSATVNEDSAAAAVNVLANDSDVENDLFLITNVTDPANGTTAITGGGTGLTYAPDPNYCNTAPVAPADTFVYTVTGGDTATVSMTVTCVNDAPVNTVPGPQVVGAGLTLTFNAANSNPISLADVDAGTAILTLNLSVGAGNGTLNLNPAALAGLATVTGQGTATIAATGTLTALNAALNGASYTSPIVPPGGPVTLTMVSNDQGATGTGGAQTDTDTVAIAIDNPPMVLTVAPVAGATQQGTNVPVSLTFSEPVNLDLGAVTVNCAPSGASYSSPVSNGITTLSAGVIGGTLAGDSCTIAVTATAVHDVDTIDPPDTLPANFSSAYTIDTAPVFVSATPAAAAVVATNSTVSFTFNEPVNGAAGAITLDCGGAIAGTVSGAGSATLLFTPSAALPAGTACTATAVAANITDVDAGDPPDNPTGNTTRSFSTDDQVTVVAGGLPTDGASNVATTTTVGFVFSENVTAAAGAITLNCGAANIAGSLSGSGSTTLTFTPTAPLNPNTACTASTVAANIADADAIDPPNLLLVDSSRSFTTDAAPTVTTTTPVEGATNGGIAADIIVNFSEAVTFSDASFTLNCAGPVLFTSSGSGTTTATINPTPILPINTPCTLVVLASGIADVDAGDPPNNLVGNFTLNFTTVNDSPPSVAIAEVEIGNNFTALPLGAGLASDSNTQVRLTFSETVNPTGPWAQLSCSISGSRTVGSGLGVTILDPVFVLSPAVNLSAGDVCTLTVFAAQVVDDDGIDPPDNMTADYVATFNVDSAPTFVSAIPAAAAVVPTNTVVSFTFSEAVNGAAGAITLNCAGPIAGTLSGSGTATLSFTPGAALPAGTACTATAVAANISDSDAGDPPDLLAGNVVRNFSTDDQVTVAAGGLPADGATNIGTGTTVSYVFSEAVTAAAGAITLNCAGPITGTLAGSGTTTLTFTPGAALPANTLCTATAVAANIADADAIDPPNLLLADSVRTFTTDAAPTVTTTTPVAGEPAFSVSSDLVVNFSESVNFTGASFTLECPVGNAIPFTVSGTGTSTATINPTANLPISTPCRLVVRAAGVTDTDAGDPPDNLAGNFTLNFTTVANLAPVLTAGGTLNYTENDAPAIIDATVTVNDADNANLASATVQLTTNYVNGEDVLSFTNTANITGVFAPISGTLTLTGSDTLAAYQTALRSVRYNNTSDTPSTLARTVRWIGNDGIVGSAPVTSTINVAVADDAPVAVADTATVVEDSGATAIDVLANDTDVDAGPRSVSAVTQPTNGTVVITGGGTGLTYQPNANYCNNPPGTLLSTFTYTLAPGSSSTTVSVTVTCVDDNPTAVADNATVAEDSGANAINVLANDTDVDGGPISVTATTQPTNGTVVITGGGTGLTYQPNANYCNNPPGTTPDTFTYTLTPGGSSTTVSVTVTCVDDPPVAVADSATVNEDSGANAINVLANDTDADAGPRSVSAVTQPTNGTVVITGGGTALTYQPNLNYCNNPPGTTLDTFTYTLAPGGSSTTVTVTVTCVNDPPVADNDAFDFVGNTELRVDLAAVATPHALETTGSTFGVLDGDSDPVEGNAVVVSSITVGSCTDNSAPFDCTDPAVGTVNMQSNGRFSFVPAPGDTGASESFTYVLTDNGLPAPASAAPATVTLTRFERVWYVRNNSAGGGNGTSATPFDTLAEAETASLANDYIFVYFGAGTVTGQNAGITLKNGQRLWGEHVGLSLPLNLNANGAPLNLVAAAAGSRPLVGNTAAGGNGVTVAATTADRTGIEIRGLSLSGTTNGVDATSTGSFNLGVLIEQNVVTAAGVEGIDINLNNTVSGTATLAVRNNDVTATGNGIDIGRGTNTGSVFITDLSNNTINGNTGGVGIGVRGFDAANPVTFDATPGGTFNAVSGGVTTIGLSGNPVGGAGLVMNFVSGVVNFTDLDSFATGNAVGVVGTGVIAASTGTLVTVPSNVGTFNSSAGPALLLVAMTADMQGLTLTSTNSTSQGLILDGVSDGSSAAIISAVAASSISNSAGVDVFINGGNANVSYAGTITDASGGVVTVSNTTGDTKTFSGAISTGQITLASNTGATIDFTGGLVLSTATNTAFSATGGGTVSVQGATNQITTTTATAVNITDTTIGGAGVTFQSINSGTASTNQVINLANTGAGPFTVTGTGTPGSGGTIDNKTDDAIRLNTTGGLVTLNRMIIEDIGDMSGASQTVSGHDAIQGLNVNGGLSLTGTTIRRISDQAIFGGNHLDPAANTVWNGLTLNGVTIEDTNRFHVAARADANNEGSVRIVGLRGTVSVTGSLFQRGGEFLDLFVTAGTLNMTVTNNDFLNAYKEFVALDNSPIASVGGHCVDVVVQGAGVANVTIGDRTVAANGNEFLNCRLGSVRLVKDTGSTGDSDFIVARNNFTVTDGSSGFACTPACTRADFDFPQGGVLHWQLGTASVDSVVETNTFTDITNASGGVGQLTMIAEGGAHNALVQNNVFTRPGNAPMFVLSRNFPASNMRLRANNNLVNGGPSLCTLDTSCAGGYTTPGLRTLFDTNQGGTMDLTMDNNQFAGHDQGFDPGETVEVRSLAPTGGNVCVNWANNRADDGYSLEEFAGTMSVVGTGTCGVGGPSADCQTVLGNRGNRGGSNNVSTNPPFIRVTPNPLTVTPTNCPVPTGGPF